MAARGSKCESDKAKFRLESGTSKGFRLVNSATNMCYCKAEAHAMSSKMEFKSDCNSELCDLEKKDESEDGKSPVVLVILASRSWRSEIQNFQKLRNFNFRQHVLGSTKMTFGKRRLIFHKLYICSRPLRAFFLPRRR